MHPRRSKISSLDMPVLEDILMMGSGYVLDFSDRTFGNFFASELEIDIDDPKYGGLSKAKRLRQFFAVSESALVARALRKLWDHRQAWHDRLGRPESIPNAEARMFQIIAKLEGDAGLARTDAIERFASDETLDELVSAIEREAQAGKPHVALDQLHTYCMKKFAHLLQERGDEVKQNEALHARAGRYFNPLRREGKVRQISEMIMKSTVDIFEKFNLVRNTESLAHDNELLVDKAEARFIFDAVVNMLRFLKSIEGNRYGA
jgi:hypothetical protein